MRYSAIGTFDDNKGYHFDGKPYAGGNDRFSYDAKSLRRFAIGLGHDIDTNIRLKFEASMDSYKLIKNSLIDNPSNRNLYGFEVVAKF